MDITRRIEFDAGHRVPGHTGHCRNVHGHRYVLEVSVDGDVPADGMVLDFGILKQVLMSEVHAEMDHAFLVHDDDPLLSFLLDAGATVLPPGEGFKLLVLHDPPTAENLAAWIAAAIEAPLWEHGVTLRSLRLWETPNASATWVAP